MKKVIFAALMLATVFSFSITTANSAPYAISKSDGRHISPSQVPAPVMSSFNNRYPNATNVQWEVEREDGSKVYQAQFRQPNGKRIKAQFAPDGTFLGQSSGGGGNDGR